MAKKVRYINVKCNTEGRIKAFEKARLMALEKGIDLTDMIIILINEGTKELDPWYEKAKADGVFPDAE